MSADATDFLKALKIDAWYKLVIAVASFALGASLFWPVQGVVTNGHLQLLSAGALLIALGEWNCHTTRQWIEPATFGRGGPYRVTQPVRRWTFVSAVLYLGGVGLVGRGLFGMWMGWPA